MGFFDKFKKKAGQEMVQSGKAESKRQAKQEEKKDLTLTELQQRAATGSVTLADEQKKVAKKTASENTREAYRVLLHPLVTEKGSYAAANGKYFFEVKGTANKYEIKKAVKALYGVMPIKVNIVNLPGKDVRYGKTRGRTSAQKKAIVTLPKGQTIEVYEGV